MQKPLERSSCGFALFVRCSDQRECETGVGVVFCLETNIISAIFFTHRANHKQPIEYTIN